MILISKSLESCLVSYGNYKPNKKNKQQKHLEKGEHEVFKNLIAKILDFK